MLRRAMRIVLVVLCAIVMVAGLAWAVGFEGPAAGQAIPRRDLFVAMLTLGVMAIAMFGFDLRDWF